MSTSSVDQMYVPAKMSTIFKDQFYDKRQLILIILLSSKKERKIPWIGESVP